MHTKLGLVLAAVLVAAPATAMTVAEFIGRVDAIKANPFLYFSHVKALKTEGKAAGAAWEAQIAPPGRKPNACPPRDVKEMTSTEFMAMLNRVPPAQRTTMTVTEATIAGLNRLYPCRA